jgi:hypothetical protein
LLLPGKSTQQQLSNPAIQKYVSFKLLIKCFQLIHISRQGGAYALKAGNIFIGSKIVPLRSIGKAIPQARRQWT